MDWSLQGFCYFMLFLNVYPTMKSGNFPPMDETVFNCPLAAFENVVRKTHLLEAGARDLALSFCFASLQGFFHVPALDL